MRSGVRTIRYLLILRILSGKSTFNNLLLYLMLMKLYSISTVSIQPIIYLFYTVWMLTLILLSLTLRVQQILTVLVIILKYGMRPMERVLITIAKAVLVITIRITTIERILIVLEYKESGNRSYRLY